MDLVFDIETNRVGDNDIGLEKIFESNGLCKPTEFVINSAVPSLIHELE